MDCRLIGTGLASIKLLSLCILIGALSASSVTFSKQNKGMEIRETWIPMADGTRLATDLYLPENMGDQSLPVLLEYLPYRKD